MQLEAEAERCMVMAGILGMRVGVGAGNGAAAAVDAVWGAEVEIVEEAVAADEDGN